MVEGDPVDRLRARARESAVAAAGLLTAVLEVADAAEPGFDADEVAFALAWTQVTARRQVELARYLTGVLPEVFTAFASGNIDTARAWVFYDQLATLDDALAAAVAGALLPVAPRLTTSQLRDRLRRAVLKADPTAAADRARRGEAARYVATTPDGDGTASMFGARLPAGRAAAAFERVDAYARARRRDGDGRTLDHLRADTFLDLLEGVGVDVPPVHRIGVVELTVPWATAVGLGADPADLAGYGPVAAAIARDLIAAYGTSTTPTAAGGGNRTRWRYSVTAPDGSLLLHDNCPAPRPPSEADPTRRMPGPALTRWIRTRDRTCRAPGCRVPARAADIDHTVDHAAGGATSHVNLAVLCRHHHRAKHQAGWTVTQPRPGRLTWISPAGRTYHRSTDPP